MHPDVCEVEKRHIKLCLNNALSEETRHLDFNAKHNPMLGWLLPWGARRLRFNGDTEGMTLSVCSLPYLHTTSPQLLFYLSPSLTDADVLAYRVMLTLKCGHTNICTSVCSWQMPAQSYTHKHTHLGTHTCNFKSDKGFADKVHWSLTCKLKLLSRWFFLFHEYWNWLKIWWICTHHLNRSGKTNMSEGDVLLCDVTHCNAQCRCHQVSFN